MVGELRDIRRAAPWEASDVSCPVLAIAGELGRPHHQRAMLELGTMLPDSTSARLHGAGHGAPNTHPVELASLLAGWLGRPTH